MLTDARVSEAEWKPTVATIVKQRRTWATWLTNESAPDEFGAYERANFVITFSYVVEGTTYTDTFIADSPRGIGETFPILFDPDHPMENSGADKKMNPWVRAAAWLVGGAIAILLSKVFPDVGS